MSTLDEESAASDERIRERIWQLVRAIAPGKVMSYGAIGARCEPPISGYICGRILQNVAPDVPWWRVVGKDGNLPIRKRHPELSAQQRQLLESEGAAFDADGRVLMEYFALD
jgi:methylated-DNA-protein-cysteine methyltransferase-like protein